jgi:phage-related protein
MARIKRVPGEKPLFWVGSSKDDLMEFPAAVRDEIRLALSLSSRLHGSVSSAVYVLHAFQKKSSRGIKTAHTDVELVGTRLRLAKQNYEARYGKKK